jgi:hypothetical protein
VIDSLSHKKARKETVNSNMGQEVTYCAGRRGQSSSGKNGNNQGKGSQDGKPKSNTSSSKTPEMKFVLHRIEKERQTVTNYIIQLVQKSFRNGKDVVDSLRKMEKIDMTKNMPIRKISHKQEGQIKAWRKKDTTCYGSILMVALVPK